MGSNPIGSTKTKTGNLLRLPVFVLFYFHLSSSRILSTII
ncbi:hypothetical protein Y592_01740 [Thermosipho sp. 1070]|nr:hypothetical protein Y592_01740 [Thermosipho sp. 1070]